MTDHRSPPRDGRSTGQEPRRVHEAIDELATVTPSAIALSDPDVRLSYAELRHQTDLLANWLREAGASSRIVALDLDRGIEQIRMVLAVLKAGAAYLPLHRGLPPTSRYQLLADTGVALLITDRPADWPSSGSVAVAEQPPLSADGPARLLAVEPETPPFSGLAYLICTSGSTGRPKAVGIPHSALSAFAYAMREQMSLTAADTVLQFHQLSFDSAAEELFPTWLAGAELRILPEAIPKVSTLHRAIADGGVTVLNLPTNYWRQWAEELTRDPRPLASQLRLVVLGGEPADAELATRWFARTGVALINTYGLTEATVSSTATRPLTTTGARRVLSSGTPITGTTRYVLDDRLQPVPDGAEGELYLGGNGIALGYLGDPRRTAQRFLPDPFRGSGARLLRTGDIARVVEDGMLEVLGRVDDQLKIRGYRVEPAEIQHALNTHPAVHTSHVGGVRGTGEPADEVQLVAWFVPVDLADPPSVKQLRGHLAPQLPDYAIPGHYVSLDRLPLTAHGKLDRAALPGPIAGAGAGLQQPVAGGLLGSVADIWSEALQVPGLTGEADFFDLGGHSLMAVRIASRVSELLERDVPVLAVFQHPVLAEFVSALADV